MTCNIDVNGLGPIQLYVSDNMKCSMMEMCILGCKASWNQWRHIYAAHIRARVKDVAAEGAGDNRS